MAAPPQQPFTLISASTPTGCERTDVRAVFEAFGPLVGAGVRFPVGAKENTMWVDFARHEDARAALLGLHGKNQKEWGKFRWNLVWDRSTRLRLLSTGVLQPGDASMKSTQVAMPQRMPPGPVKRVQPNTSTASAAESTTAAGVSGKHVSPAFPIKKVAGGPLATTGMRTAQAVLPMRPTTSAVPVGAKGRAKVPSAMPRPIVATPETAEQRVAMAAAVASMNRTTATIKAPAAMKPRVAAPGFSLDDLLPSPSPRTPVKASARSPLQASGSPMAGHSKPTPPEKLAATVTPSHKVPTTGKNKPQPIHESGSKRTPENITVVSGLQQASAVSPVVGCSAQLDSLATDVGMTSEGGQVAATRRRKEMADTEDSNRAGVHSDTSSSESSSDSSGSSCSDSRSDGGSQPGESVGTMRQHDKPSDKSTVPESFDETQQSNDQNDDHTSSLVAGSFAKLDVLVSKLSKSEISGLPSKRKLLKVLPAEIEDSAVEVGTQQRKVADLTKEGWYGVQRTSLADNSLIATFPF